MLQLEGVTKRYRGSVSVLEAVDWFVGDGDAVCLTGPSGAGKTSLIRLLSGFEYADSGVVRVFRRNVAKLRRKSVAALRRQIGIVPQEIRLLDDRSATANVSLALEVAGMPRRIIRDWVAQALNRVGLSETEVPVGQLSSGQRRLVSIARAIVVQPAAILADEPTADLDEASARRILELFEELRQAGTAVLVTTHDERTIRLAERQQWQVFDLRDGQLYRMTEHNVPTLELGLDVASPPNVLPFPGHALAAGAGE